jgi:FAD/FMN-containing dehydrogenase/Fe-S oxidoreductase
MTGLPKDFIQKLNVVLEDKVRTDYATRILYSTDASIYKIKPLGVVFPKHIDELQIIMELASQYHVPVVARGAGSSLAGQAIGNGLIIDCSRHLDDILDFIPEEQKIIVEPGVILNTLNHKAAPYRLQFGPDPSSAERATIGGSVSNNATGSHSILYGMSADHVLSVDVVLSDGSLAKFKEIPLESAYQISQESGIFPDIYKSALMIRDNLPAIIKERWPKTYRTVSGYNLNYLLPWSASIPPRWNEFFKDIPYPPVMPGNINLAQLVAGSEGTLAIIRSLELRLVNVPQYKILAVLGFNDISEACDHVPSILDHKPSAIELIPKMLVQLARSIPGYAASLPIEFDVHQSMLVVEFAGDDLSELKAKIQQLGENTLVAESPVKQNQIWSVRKVGLGILMSRPGEYKPVPGIEDMSVPIEHLGEFVREIERIFTEHNTSGDFYGHASAGCLHIRPILNIKTPTGMSEFRSIAHACLNLVQKFGGSISAEHGDGLARGEWLGQLFGNDILKGFKELKLAADPTEILNPGKKVHTPKMDQNIRYSYPYRANAWEPIMDFSNQGGYPGEIGLISAVEQCNGAGVCRKQQGVMCPSFQVTHNEMHSTRGRANLLREMMYGSFPSENLAMETVYEALDLCLACKGCKVECPSAVDMAKLKYEFINHYYETANHRRSLSDYLFGYINIIARYTHPIAPIVNTLLKNPLIKKIGEKSLGLSRHRNFPNLSRKPFHVAEHKSNMIGDHEKVLVLLDTFNQYYYPENCEATLHLLQKLGYGVQIIPVIGAGRTLLSKGFLTAARKHAVRLVDSISEMDPMGECPIIGIEPSEIYTLRDELPDLLANDERVHIIKKRAYMIDEFLIRPDSNGVIRINKLRETYDFSGNVGKTAVVHGHCYQKAQSPAEDGFPIGVEATVNMLEHAGYIVSKIDDGCCGMAGAFGYEADHYNLSMRIGELALFPAIREAIRIYRNGVIIAVSGVSCKAQIEDGTGTIAIHPIRLINCE